MLCQRDYPPATRSRGRSYTAGILLLQLLTTNGHLGIAQHDWHFKDVTQSTGVDLIVSSGTPEKEFLVETMTGGVCVLDFDGDGWPDLFFANGTDRRSWNRKKGPSDRLYRNNRDGTFSDATAPAGLRDSAWGMGCVTADYDNDGDTDLYVTNYGPNFLYRNQGNGRFFEVGVTGAVADPGWSTGAAFGDYDKDGHLDLYLANYLEFDFEKSSGDPQYCAYAGVAVACGPRSLPGAQDRLFRNKGDGTFEDVSDPSGVSASERSYGFQPLWTDVDLDGDLDVFVANDSNPNFLWRNNGDGTFTEISLLMGLAYNQDGREQANMGVDVGDYDGDGLLDLYSTNFSNDYHVLYQNRKTYFADATFSAQVAQVTFRYLGFGALLADFNNDFRADIFVANGHIYPEVDRFKLGTEYRQPNQMFQNRGDGRFVEVGKSLGEGLGIVKSSRGAAWLDWDRDGDLDIVVVNLDDRVDLLRNDAPGRSNFLQVYLRGHTSNRDGIGARVTARLGERTHSQELHAGSSYLSDSQRMFHFGLGDRSTVDRLEVVWPSGQRQEFKDVAANRRVLLEEGKDLRTLK